MSDAVNHAIDHPTRRRIIEALWHEGEPMSAKTLHREYVDSDQVTLAMVSYHLRQLELDGIATPGELDGVAHDRDRPYFLANPNGAEAVRRLKLTHSDEDRGSDG